MLNEIIAYVHLIGVAIGLGMAARLDIMFFVRRNKRLDDNDFKDIESSHLMISCALLVGWITGVVLLYMLTGFDIATFSPKLWAKLFVVSALSLNAIAISQFVFPILRRNRGGTILEIPTRQKIPMALCAATSAMCWMTALALGAMSFLKTQTKEFLATMLSVEIAVGVCLAVGIAVLLKPKTKSKVTTEDVAHDAPDFSSRREDGSPSPRNNPSKGLRKSSVSNA